MLKNPKHWNLSIRALVIFANICNLGILVHIIIPFLPMILPAIIIPQTIIFLKIFTFYSDPLIYVCKILNRAIRYLGRRMHIVFDEDKYGEVHPLQNRSDFISGLLFAIAIAAFFTPASLFPLQAFVGWVAGIAGVSINLFFDEIYPARKAKHAWMLETNSNRKSEMEDNYKQHHYESIFYGCIIASLVLFLPCSSLSEAHVLPEMAEGLLNFIATLGSASIVLLNLLRFANFISCNIFYGVLAGLEEKPKQDGDNLPPKTELSHVGILQSLTNLPKQDCLKETGTAPIQSQPLLSGQISKEQSMTEKGREFALGPD